MAFPLPAVVRPSEWMTVAALLRREFILLLRRWLPFLVLATLVMTATYVTAASWPSRFAPVGTFPASQFMGSMAFLFLLGAYIVLPGLSALSISAEKERETYEQLFLTLIRPGGLLIGKLLNTLGFYFLLLIACLPFFGCLFFLTGVDWPQMTLMLGIVSATAFACASAGLMCSAWCRRSASAVALSYVMATALSGVWCQAGLSLAYLAFGSRSFVLGASSLWMFSCPPYALAVLLKAPPTKWTWHIGFPIAYQVACGVLFLWLARHALRRPPKPPKVSARAVIDDPAQLERRRKRFPYYLIDPLKRQKSFEDGRNPMLVKELRWGLLTRGPRLVRTFYIAFIIALLLSVPVVLRASYASDVYDETSLVFIVLAVEFAAVTPLLLASLLPKELEQGNMDLLRSTLLLPREIILGKVGAGFLSLAPLLLAFALPLLLFGAMLLLRNINNEFLLFIAGCGTLAACLVFSVGLATFASTVARRTLTSLIVSYALTFLGYIGLAGGCLLLIVLTGQRLNTSAMPRFSRARVPQSWLEMLSTYTGAGEAAFLSPLTAFIWTGHHKAVAPLYSSLGASRGVYWLANVITFTLVGGLFILYSIRFFARNRMQDE